MKHKTLVSRCLKLLAHEIDTRRRHTKHCHPQRCFTSNRDHPVLDHAGHRMCRVTQHLPRNNIEPCNVNHGIHHGDVAAVHIRCRIATCNSRDHDFWEPNIKCSHGWGDQRCSPASTDPDHARDLPRFKLSQQVRLERFAHRRYCFRSSPVQNLRSAASNFITHHIGFHNWRLSRSHIDHLGLHSRST